MIPRLALHLAVVLATPCITPLLAQDGRTSAGSSVSTIVFNGVLVQGSVTKVSLSNPTTGETKWVQVGKSYGGYTVGYEPGKPATKQTPATKDSVLLTLNGSVQRIELQNASVGTTGTASKQSLEEANMAVLVALNDRLAQARSDPNADPRLIQEIEVDIARQQQKIFDDREFMGSFYMFVNGHEEMVHATMSADGQQTVTLENGQQFTTPPGRVVDSIENGVPDLTAPNRSSDYITTVNGQQIFTYRDKQYPVPPGKVVVGGNDQYATFAPAPAPYTVPPGQVILHFDLGDGQPKFGPAPAAGK